MARITEQPDPGSMANGRTPFAANHPWLHWRHYSCAQAAGAIKAARVRAQEHK